MNEWINKLSNNKRMNGCIFCEWMSGSINAWMNVKINKQVKELINNFNESMNNLMNWWNDD